MTVSMDGLRNNAISAYNNLIGMLRKNRNIHNSIEVEQEDIEEALEDLRETLVFLACSYQEGEDGWKAFINPKIDSITN